MTYQQKITKAKARLMLEQPYFGTIASSLDLKKNNEILTFVSDGYTMSYNSEYLERLNLDEVEFMMANGAMHTVLQHTERLNNRTQWLWQTATDYVVNAMLVKNGMTAPEYANYEPKFEGMYAEEVYDILRSEMMDNSDYSMEQETEQITDANDDIHAENITMHEDLESNDLAKDTQTQQDSQEKKETATTEEMQEHMEQIFQKLKRQGDLPKDLAFVIPQYFSHQVDWREFLYGYIATHAKTSYSFSPPNMKYLYRGIYLPSLSSDLLRVIIAIDTSGSVDETLLGTFLAEVSSMMQQYPNYEIDLITADAKVHTCKTFLPGEPLTYEVNGGGGTDFRPVFDYIDKHIDYPTLLLYFTDGQGTFPKDTPSYDVLWVMPEPIEIPFGEVVILENI